jgi:hypothetical protein
MKIRSVGTELFHADGQTDMTKLTVAFRNVATAPKNWLNWLKQVIQETKKFYVFRQSEILAKNYTI